MADNWLAQAVISQDPYMAQRVAQAAARNGVTEVGIDPDAWAHDWRRVWAAAPGWWEAWQSALAGGIPEPGRDPGVITDGMVETQVQDMMPFTLVADHAPEAVPASSG